MISIAYCTELPRPVQVPNTAENFNHYWKRVMISSRRKSCGAIHFPPQVQNCWADSAAELMSWPLEALAFTALEVAGGAGQGKRSSLARGHTVRTVLARAVPPGAFLGSARHLLSMKDSLS